MAYIADADITDLLANQFSTDFPTYHSLSDNKLIDLGVQLGVMETADFAVDGSGYISSWYIKQYIVAWFCMRLFLDKMGLNNISLPEMEKYNVKYTFYKKEVSEKESRITRQMLTGDVENISDRAKFTGFLYRS